MQSNKLKIGVYIIILALLALMAVSVLMLLGSAGMGVFAPGASSARPTAILATPTLSPSPGTEEQLDPIDQLIDQAMSASFAYNVPDSMQLQQTVTLQLLLNPVVAPDALATQISEIGTPVSGTIDVTPRMKAELKAQDADALLIRPLYDNPEKIISAKETTQWEWWVTAKKEGSQHLTLVIYRLVKYEGLEYWREVRTYQSNINITVTLEQRLQAVDWKWLAGILIPAVLIPAFWRWADGRKSRRRRG